MISAQRAPVTNAAVTISNEKRTRERTRNVRVGADEIRLNRAIRNAKTFHTIHLQIVIHNAAFFTRRHLACSNRMPGVECFLGNVRFDFCTAHRLRILWQHELGDLLTERRRSVDLAKLIETFNQTLEVVGVLQEVWLNFRQIACGIRSCKMSKSQLRMRMRVRAYVRVQRT